MLVKVDVDTTLFLSCLAALSFVLPAAGEPIVSQYLSQLRAVGRMMRKSRLMHSWATQMSFCLQSRVSKRQMDLFYGH
jgi:hypothetical protein